MLYQDPEMSIILTVFRTGLYGSSDSAAMWRFSLSPPHA